MIYDKKNIRHGDIIYLRVFIIMPRISSPMKTEQRQLLLIYIISLTIIHQTRPKS